MDLKTRFSAPFVSAFLALAATVAVRAGDTTVTTSTTTAEPDTRYGLFNLFDHRSSYGQGVFPEPFLVDDSDQEINEFRLDDLHTTVPGSHSDAITAEVE